MTLDELLRSIHELFMRGFIDLNSSDFIIRRLPDGRYEIKLRR